MHLFSKELRSLEVQKVQPQGNKALFGGARGPLAGRSRDTSAAPARGQGSGLTPGARPPRRTFPLHVSPAALLLFCARAGTRRGGARERAGGAEREKAGGAT